MRKPVPQEKADERAWELLYYRAANKITPERFVDLFNLIDMRPDEFPEASHYDWLEYKLGTFSTVVKTGFMDGVITAEEYDAILEGRPLNGAFSEDTDAF